ncbi:MAG: GldG family protein, partial [Gammaproteobacteria bacterium]
MQVSPQSRRFIRLQNLLFLFLFLIFIGMLAWLSTHYVFQSDWTASGRNTLSPASQALLKKLDGPISITAFSREARPLRKGISEMIKRYQRYKPDIRLSFVDPAKEPQRVRELGISVDGELVIAYSGRSEKVQDINEQNLTNALQRVARNDKRWLVFLAGHGERNPLGVANHDLGDWGRQLEGKGFNVQTVNLVTTPQIPANTNVLVIAAPQVDLLPGEIKLIQDYISKGGNLLWLSDPGPLHGLAPIAEQLGIEFQPGVIVDPNAQLFGVVNPDFAVVSEYSAHPITLNFTNVTLFPQASGIDLKIPDGWQGEAFLTTQPRSWSETGALQG